MLFERYFSMARLGMQITHLGIRSHIIGHERTHCGIRNSSLGTMDLTLVLGQKHDANGPILSGVTLLGVHSNSYSDLCTKITDALSKTFKTNDQCVRVLQNALEKNFA